MLMRSGQARRALGDGARGVADWRRAAALMEAVPDMDSEMMYVHAECHSLLSSPTGPADPRVSADKREAEANRAMALLQRAVGMGFRDSATYRNDPALDPLRGRDDFRLMMMDLEMPADPFAPGR